MVELATLNTIIYSNKTMKIIFLCILVAVNATDVEEQWKVFKAKHGKQYRSLLEDTKRFQIFKENLGKIEEHNKKFELGETSYKLGVNKFADLTEDEFKARLNLKPSAQTDYKTVVRHANINVPNEVDWRREGAVTKVKDQGDCGACWAFGTTGTLESHYYLKTGKLISLSEQYLVDCSVGFNNGCKGGWTQNAYQFIRNYGAVPEESYPYEARDSTCRANGTLFKDIGFFLIPEDENAMKVAVAGKGPIAVAIDASYLYLYEGGVFDNNSCSTTSTNHVVLVVGYGTTVEGIEYWLVKNSWGVDWGEEGYLKMSRNKNNQCNIVSTPMYPIL